MQPFTCYGPMCEPYIFKIFTSFSVLEKAQKTEEEGYQLLFVSHFAAFME